MEPKDKKKLDDKFGSINDLMGSGNDEPTPKPPMKRRRPPPAAKAISSEPSPKTMIETLAEANESLKGDLAKLSARNKDLEAQRDQFEAAKDLAVTDALNSTDTDEAMVLTMPISKKDVSFRLQRIPHALIDVSLENERNQEFLDEISLADILPSMRAKKQQKPGMCRPKADGRFELIEGSRRNGCCRLDDIDFLTLVGDVPDIDVRELSEIENRHKDVSIFEKAHSYDRRIKKGEFTSWVHLAASYNISEKQMYRWQTVLKLETIFVRILPSPSDMTLSYAEDVIRMMNRGADETKKLKIEAKELLALRTDAKINESDPIDYDTVVKRLKSAGRKKIQKAGLKRPVKKPSRYAEKAVVKQSVSNNGNIKFELIGFPAELTEEVIEKVYAALKVKT